MLLTVSPPTLPRRRDDARAAKHEVEEAQRAERRAHAEAGTSHEPRFFRRNGPAGGAVPLHAAAAHESQQQERHCGQSNAVHSGGRRPSLHGSPRHHHPQSRAGSGAAAPRRSLHGSPRHAAAAASADSAAAPSLLSWAPIAVSGGSAEPGLACSDLDAAAARLLGKPAAPSVGACRGGEAENNNLVDAAAAAEAWQPRGDSFYKNQLESDEGRRASHAAEDAAPAPEPQPPQDGARVSSLLLPRRDSEGGCNEGAETGEEEESPPVSPQWYEGDLARRRREALLIRCADLQRAAAACREWVPMAVEAAEAAALDAALASVVASVVEGGSGSGDAAAEEAAARPGGDDRVPQSPAPVTAEDVFFDATSRLSSCALRHHRHALMSQRLMSCIRDVRHLIWFVCGSSQTRGPLLWECLTSLHPTGWTQAATSHQTQAPPRAAQPPRAPPSPRRPPAAPAPAPCGPPASRPRSPCGTVHPRAPQTARRL